MNNTHDTGRTKGRLTLTGVILTMTLLMVMGTAAAQSSQENAITQLRQFVADTHSASGTFTQTVHAASGRQPQESSGRFMFQRPGKFRWEYEKPYPQTLVSDGKMLWSWDPDLNQVTVNAMGDALGNTPAAILAGDGKIDDNFKLAEAGNSDGLAWVQAVPLETDSTFESMRMGFSGGELKRMELRDNFGQLTQIVFSSLVSGGTIDPENFHFDVPAGADVIGQ